MLGSRVGWFGVLTVLVIYFAERVAGVPLNETKV
jgi:hypothetical protein